MFRSVTIIRSLYLNLAKVTIVKSSVKIHRYKLCSGVAALLPSGLQRIASTDTQLLGVYTP